MTDTSQLTITDADVTKIRNAIRSDLKKDFEKTFATKDELNNVRKELKELSDTTHQGFSWMVAEFAKIRSEMVNKTDLAEIMGELRTIREELAINSYRTSQHSEALVQHDKRITTLEEKSVF